MHMSSIQASATLLDQALQHPTNPATRTEIIKNLWENCNSANLQSFGILSDAYFVYYTKQCKRSLRNQGLGNAARTHQEIIQIVHAIKSSANREDVGGAARQLIKKTWSPEVHSQMIEGTIKLATHLLTMVDTGDYPKELPSGKMQLDWTEGPLQQLIHVHFNCQPREDFEDVTLRHKMTARHINRIARIQILATDNLLDHLRLEDEDQTLCVFHHVSFLRHMKATNSPMFPAGLVEETLNTLVLLFPDKDKKNSKWLKKWMEGSDTVLDRGLLTVGQSDSNWSSNNLHEYKYWGDRLGSLHEAVEFATPSSEILKEFLRDNKSSDRWLNSWVAIVAIGLTLFFGMVQSIEGAIQVYKAYH